MYRALTQSSSGKDLMIDRVMDLWPLLAVAIPNMVIWSYSVGASIFVIGLVQIFYRDEWQKARGFDKLIIFGPLFYAAPLAAFGTEHFTLTAAIASIVPRYIPWHLFWAYFVGACFIAGPLSMVTRIQARVAASLLALTFLLFEALMDAPVWLHHPGNRLFAILTLRELSFSGGALAFAVSLTYGSRPDHPRKWPQVFATIARYFIAIPVLFYSFEQFIHADHVPGVPLERLTPTYIFGHSIWTYLAAVVYAVVGILLVLGKKMPSAAAWLGFTVFFIVLVVYVPIAVAERASLNNGLNYLGDTLMYCGAILLL